MSKAFDETMGKFEENPNYTMNDFINEFISDD